MNVKRYTEDQVICLLKANDAGAKMIDLVREQGIS